MPERFSRKSADQKYYITRSGRAKARKIGLGRLTMTGRVLHYLSVGDRGAKGRAIDSIVVDNISVLVAPLGTENFETVRRALAGLIKKGYVSLKPQKG